MEGLPSILSDVLPLCCDYSAANSLADWFEMTEEEKSVYEAESDLSTIETALRLIYQEVTSGARELIKRV